MADIVTQSKSKHYPRWILRDDGARIVVNNHIEHSAHMRQEFDENAQPVMPAQPVIQAPPAAPVADPLGIFAAPRKPRAQRPKPQPEPEAVTEP